MLAATVSRTGIGQKSGGALMSNVITMLEQQADNTECSKVHTFYLHHVTLASRPQCQKFRCHENSRVAFMLRRQLLSSSPGLHTNAGCHTGGLGAQAQVSALVTTDELGI